MKEKTEYKLQIVLEDGGCFTLDFETKEDRDLSYKQLGAGMMAKCVVEITNTKDNAGMFVDAARIFNVIKKDFALKMDRVKRPEETAEDDWNLSDDTKDDIFAFFCGGENEN